MNTPTKAAVATTMALAIGIGVYELSNGPSGDPVDAGTNIIRIDSFTVTNVYNTNSHLWGKKFDWIVSGCEVGSTNYMLFSDDVKLPMNQWQPLSIFVTTSDPYTFTRTIVLAWVVNSTNIFNRVLALNTGNGAGFSDAALSTAEAAEYLPVASPPRVVSTNRTRIICTNFPPPPPTNVVKRIRK